MAGTVTINTGLKAVLDTGETLVSKSGRNSNYDLAGSRSYANVQIVGTAYEAIAFGADLATKGWATFRNLDPTNFVELGLEVSAAFYAFAKLLPGEECVFPIGGTLFAKADTAPCDLEVVAVER